MRLIGIGFGSYIAAEKIVTVLTPDSAPIKRLISDGRERGLLIDASFGRSTKSVLLMNSSHIILSSLTPDDLFREIQGNKTSDSTKGGIESWKIEED
jgi:hypothetical protein